MPGLDGGDGAFAACAPEQRWLAAKPTDFRRRGARPTARVEPAYPETTVVWSSVDDAGRGVAMELRSRMLVLRAEFMLRRANRRRRLQLAAELANYTSQTDLNDLFARLDTYPDAQTHEIRQILCQQQAFRTWRAWGAR